MSFKVDLWDLGALAGASLVVLGLGLIAWPLILVGLGGGVLGFCVMGAKKWASSARS